MSKPSLPLCYRGDDRHDSLDLSVLSASVNDAALKRQEAYDTSRKLQSCIISIRNQIGTVEAEQSLNEVLETYSDTLPRDKATNRLPREANLSHAAEDLVRTAAYHHFLTTGTLLPPVDWTTDEEYLAGAVMGLCGDLQHYGLGRATVRDVESVQAACDLVSACLDYLLELDFRNGPLRRKYDGCKYSLKALETFLYELAVTSSSPPASDTEPAHKRIRRDTELLLPVVELELLKQRMERRDENRETLIKKCRDGQKTAKQSIFALHRGDVEKAAKLLQQCAVYIQTELLPIVQEEPPLRYGSFASVLEEYAEAKLFFVWLHGKDYSTTSTDGDGAGVSTTAQSNDTSNDGSVVISGTILLPDDFTHDILALEADEYVGGLCDLTGEIGRYAVQRGTERDVTHVRHCLQANTDIYTAVRSMERLPAGTSGGNGGSQHHGMAKKLEMVRSSVQKIERMLYELSLSEAAGGRNVHTDVPMDDANDDDNER